MIDPPSNLELGFVWKPEMLPGGPLAGTKTESGYELGKIAEGLIRVVKVCRDCGKERDAWMFLPIYRKVMRETEAAREESGEEERPYFVGVGGWCDPCVTILEHNRDRKKYEQELEVAQRQWEGAKTEREMRPVAWRIKKLLGALIETVSWGSPKFMKYTARLEKVEQWIEDHRSDHAA